MAEAGAFWADASQRIGGASPETLPDEGIEYRACGPVCGAFHYGMWPDVWMAHYGVKPAGWGQLVAPARQILATFWAEMAPQLIIGWTPSENRAAVAFAGRLGFEVTGEMVTKSGQKVITQQWRGA